MIKELTDLKNKLQKQIILIQNPDLGLMNQIILTRSLIENYAIYNFLKEAHTEKRIELFQCFGDFEWYSHQIYDSKPKSLKIRKFKNFLVTTQAKYPYGYSKYGRLIKRRCCKQLRSLVNSDPNHANDWQSQLDLINSDQASDHNQQINILATYMSHHLITKLPFPYRIVFGKSITYFVLKYSQINRNTYWLLADLAHGTLIENHLNHKGLIKIIQNLLAIIKNGLKH